MLKDDNIQQIGWNCAPDEAGHCITCSDEALPATVLEVDAEGLVALVIFETGDTSTRAEIDISLVESVEPGEILLVHGGLALGREPGLNRPALKLEANRL